jgi:hypothetical protein
MAATAAWDLSLTLVIVGGVALLMVLAVCVGASMDTEAQRREWRRVAKARRKLRQLALDVPDTALCERCPYRNDGV